MIAMMLLIASLVAFMLGYFVGRYRKHEYMYRVCRDQQARGDYWHDRYREAIRMSPMYGDDE